MVQTGLRPVILAISVLAYPVLSAAAPAQQDSRQAVCQASWESCLGFAEGKNWKPVYDRCLKARTACLRGQAFRPQVMPVSSAPFPLQQDMGAGSDLGNADPLTHEARCQDGMRGERGGCTLAVAGEGYGQTFSLLGPGIPLSRSQRTSSVVRCAGGSPALFYPNGRIESCVLDGYGAGRVLLTDYAGKTAACAVRAAARFDPEGRLLSCMP